MDDRSKLLLSLPLSLRDGVRTLAKDEGVSVDDLLVMAVAEKLARAEHSAWLVQNGWLQEAGPRWGRPTGRIIKSRMKRFGETAHLPDGEEESERLRLAELFEGAPVFIAVTSGPEHVFELVNQAYREMLGERDLIGMRVVDCVPEVADTIYMEHLDRVYRTGVPWVERGARLSLAPTRGHMQTDKYVDYTYKARRRADGTITGIINLGVDTSRVRDCSQAACV